MTFVDILVRRLRREKDDIGPLANFAQREHLHLRLPKKVNCTLFLERVRNPVEVARDIRAGVVAIDLMAAGFDRQRDHQSQFTQPANPIFMALMTS